MSKKLFTEQEIMGLVENKYVAKATQKSIKFTVAFKLHFLEEYAKGNVAKVIFEKAGINPNILGSKRIEQCTSRWRMQDKRASGLTDGRCQNKGRPLKDGALKGTSVDDLNARIAYLEMENKFLKKLQEIETRAIKKSKLKQGKNSKTFTK